MLCPWVLGSLGLFGQLGPVFLGLHITVETAAYSGSGLAWTSFFSFTLSEGRFLCIITILSAWIYTPATSLPVDFYDEGCHNSADLFPYFLRIATFSPWLIPYKTLFLVLFSSILVERRKSQEKAWEDSDHLQSSRLFFLKMCGIHLCHTWWTLNDGNA